MRKLWRHNRKGFTLIEVLVSVAIFAAVALPLMSVFLQSAKTDRAARNVMNANYIAQDYIETLDAKTYKQALSALPNLEARGDYYLSATIEPYGNAKNALFAGNDCVYAHLVMRSDGSLLTVLPDGQWLEYSSVPTAISISLSSSGYTFSAGGKTKAGTAAYSRCAVLVSAMNWPGGASPLITAGAGCKVMVYCKSGDVSDIRVDGEAYYHKDIIAGDTSLVRVAASIYDSKTNPKPVATTEVYLSLRNE